MEARGVGLVLSVTRNICLALLWLSFSGCAVGGDVESPPPAPAARARPREDILRPPSLRALASGAESPPSPEEVSERLSNAAEGWFYGPGLGTAMLNVGIVVLFPPYILYLVGNAGLSLAGYEPLYPSDTLPGGAREEVLDAYNSVVSVPGDITSAIAGREGS